ncbi:MAG: hypothetical protein WC861_00315 [Candidatus Micrarchaeia archaeon]
MVFVCQVTKVKVAVEDNVGNAVKREGISKNDLVLVQINAKPLFGERGNYYTMGQVNEITPRKDIYAQTSVGFTGWDVSVVGFGKIIDMNKITPGVTNATVKTKDGSSVTGLLIPADDSMNKPLIAAFDSNKERKDISPKVIYIKEENGTLNIVRLIDVSKITINREKAF